MSITLEVSGMTCAHCVHAVTKALESVPGVERAEVNLEGKRARVDGEVEAEALLRAVEKQGYEAKLAAAQ
jgi:copper chaperone